MHEPSVLPDLARDDVVAKLAALAADPALAFVPGGPERWFVSLGDRRLRLRATVHLLTGVRHFRAQRARAWLRERGVGFEREKRVTGYGVAYDRLPDLDQEEVVAAWDADLASDAGSHLLTGPNDWDWGVRHRGRVLPLKRAVAFVAKVPSTDFHKNDAAAWLARRGFEIVPPAGDPPRWWIFQGNPSTFDLRGALGSLDRLTWGVRQHKDQIRPQDRVLFWESGPDGGAVGVGTVLCSPIGGLESEDEEPFVRDAGNIPIDGLDVWVRIDERFDPLVGRAELADDPALATLRVLQPAPNFTNAPVTELQARHLVQRLGLAAADPTGATAEAEPPHVDPRTHDILRVLTRIPVSRGQVLFFHLLRHSASGVRARDVQDRVFEEDPHQGAGLLAALSRRINGTSLATGANQGLTLLADRHPGERWVARPELWEAIDLLPRLRDELALPWEELRQRRSYIDCTMPQGLEVARAAEPAAETEAPWQRLRRRVGESLVISDEVLASFVLALQAKRFVIFSGISGTGKTRLAQTVAQWAVGTAAAEEPEDVATPFGVEIEVQPYMLTYSRVTLPSAIVRRARLPVSGAGWSSAEVEVTWPEGTMKLRLGTEASRPGVCTLLLKGPALGWLKANVQVGDRVVLDVVPGPDEGWDGLRLALPRQGASRPARTYELIPVRPDWKDTRSLLGFYNPITESYSRTPFLDLLLAARSEAQRADKEGREPLPFFAVLDEMNLAHVEQYFADVLSAMESGEEIPLHGDTRVDQGLADGAEQVPARVRLPRNLFVVGTVNVDETTHAFSPKVLDRAFVIELSEVWLDRDPPPSPLALVRLPDQLSLLGRVDRAAWDRLDTTAGPGARRVLLAFQRTLAHEGRPIGYRPLFEIARFLQLAFEQGGDEASAAALDQAVLQKLLPKLNGRQHELEPVLRRLFDVSMDGRSSVEPAYRYHHEAWHRRHDGLLAPNDDAEAEGLDEPLLPRCAARLHRMVRDVRRQGFVSFVG